MYEPTPIARSRAHVALAEIFDAGLARAMACYAGDPQLPAILLAADFLDMKLAGAACPIDLLSLQNAAGLDRQAAETVCMMVGARQRGFRDWTTAKPGKAEGDRLIVQRGDFLEHAMENIEP